MKAAVDPDAARDAARHIVSGRQYRSAPTPRPFRKPLNWLGDRLHGIVHWFGRVLDSFPWPLLFVLALVVVIAAVTYVLVTARTRRGGIGERRGASPIPGEESEDPDELERLADT